MYRIPIRGKCDKMSRTGQNVSQNKSKLCNLVELYSPFPLPKMIDIDYMETYKCRGCGVRYESEAGQVKAFLSFWNGIPILSIECEELGFDKVFRPDIDILNLYGLNVPKFGTEAVYDKEDTNK